MTNDSESRVCNPRWVSVSDRKPPLDRPVLLWGSKLEPDDFAVPGSLCACHHRWLLVGFDDLDGNSRHLERLLGEVTHWLEYGPPSARGTPASRFSREDAAFLIGLGEYLRMCTSQTVDLPVALADLAGRIAETVSADPR